MLSPDEVGIFIKNTGGEEARRTCERMKKGVPGGGLFGGDHIHQEDGVGVDG